MSQTDILTMTLEGYLQFRSLTAAAFGRRLSTISDPYDVKRYLKLLRSGAPNKRYRRPDWPVLLDIYEKSERLVTPNDWI